MVSQKQNSHYWRLDITGLRALAVLPVLFFHAFPSLLPGGFLGVDIFFVISGYLISGIIFRDLELNRFSYRDFYTKRIKRILPNLICVLAFVFILGWFFLSSGEFKSLGQHIYSSAAFYQNFRLLSDIGYFDLSSIEKPLLHLWSLAIEEQFYIFFPLICTLIWKFSSNKSRAVGIFLALLIVSSFITTLCLDDQSQRFYLPLPRFWELGAGILIAYAERLQNFDTKKLSIGLRHGLSILGLVLVCGSMLLYTDAYQTPGIYSLLPVIGAALLITANDDAVINRTLLSWKVFSFIGLISYSLYLWHWPLISYLHIVTPQAPQWHYGIAVLISFPLAVFVYACVENPVRRAKSNKTVIVILIVSLLLCAVAGQVVKHQKGFPNREIAQAFSFTDDFTYREITHSHKFDGVPVLSFDKEKTPEILFIGDSHIEQYAPRAEYLFRKTGINAAFIANGGCLASTGTELNGSANKKCAPMPEYIEKLLKNPQIKVVVIGQMWGGLHNKVFNDGMNRYLEWLKKYASEKKFHVVLDAPWGDACEFDLKKQITNRLDIDSILKQKFEVDYPSNPAWSEGNIAAEKYFSAYADLIKTDVHVCPNRKCNLLNYKDDDHLRSSYIASEAFWIDRIYKLNN